MRVKRIRLSWIVPLSLPLWLGGCLLGGCLVQGRGIALYGLMDGGDIRTVSPQADSAVSSITFGESRGAGVGEEHTVGWLIRAWTVRGTPTAVRLREGALAAAGAVLYNFPLTEGQPSAGVVTQGGFIARDAAEFGRNVSGDYPVRRVAPPHLPRADTS